MSFLNLSDIAPKEPIPGFHARFVHTDQLTIAHFEVDAGAALLEHAHPHEQISNILSGEFEFTLDGETRIVGPGSVVVIPGNMRHSGRAITQCRIVDIFCPARDDYRS